MDSNQFIEITPRLLTFHQFYQIFSVLKGFVDNNIGDIRHYEIFWINILNLDFANNNRSTQGKFTFYYLTLEPYI